MAVAGTARFPAPTASFEVRPSRALAWVLVALNALALANLVAWWHWAAPPQLWVLVMVCCVWLVGAVMTARAYGRLPTGRLVWNAENWSFEHTEHASQSEALGLAADVALDFQFCMLLQFSQANRSAWICVTRKHDPAHWLALRRAVYSPAMVMPLPSQADALGTIPAA